MIASSILNMVTFKDLSGNYPNIWNTLHADRRQGNNRNIPYYQKFQKDHVLYLQFISDVSLNITLTAYCGLATIETITNVYSTSYGSTNKRYFTNFVITLDSDYYEKKVFFKAVQGANTLTSEPILTTDLTDLINSGIVKYIQYTNIDRIESDLDDRFIDWSALTSPGSFLDLYVEAVDNVQSDTDETEVLEGSQNKTIVSATYFSGRTLKTAGIPDYLATKLGMITSLDVFLVNSLEYVKQGQLDQANFGNSTLFQVTVKMTQKNAIGINVDNIGIAEPIIPDVSAKMYVGTVDNIDPDESQVKAMAQREASTDDLVFNIAVMFDLSMYRYCLGYPSSLGLLTSILDHFGHEIISGFAITEKTFTIDSVQFEYTIYTLIRPTYRLSPSITFKF